MLFKQVNEKGRRAGGKPEVLELPRVEKKIDGDGIVNAFCIQVEAIAVVPILHFGQQFFPAEAHQFRGGGDFLCKIFLQFLLGVAQHIGVSRVQADVLQVVETGKNAHFGKLAHAGEEDKFQQVIVVFEYRIKLFENIPRFDGFSQILAQMVNHRRIVLVYQYNDLGFRRQAGNEILQTIAGRAFRDREAGFFGEDVQLAVERFLQGEFRVAQSGEGDANDRMPLVPVPFVFYPQAFEQLAAAGIQLLQSGDGDGLAKTARAGEEEKFSSRSKLMDIAGLIHILVAIFYEGAKILYPDG